MLNRIMMQSKDITLIFLVEFIVNNGKIILFILGLSKKLLEYYLLVTNLVFLFALLISNYLIMILFNLLHYNSNSKFHVMNIILNPN